MKKSAVLLALLLAGCEAVVPVATANYKMTQAKSVYRACLEANPSDPGNCESQKRIYELELTAYRSTHE